jgi:hypothetical protein
MNKGFAFELALVELHEEILERILTGDQFLSDEGNPFLCVSRSVRLEPIELRSPVDATLVHPSDAGWREDLAKTRRQLIRGALHKALGLGDPPLLEKGSNLVFDAQRLSPALRDRHTASAIIPKKDDAGRPSRYLTLLRPRREEVATSRGSPW